MRPVLVLSLVVAACGGPRPVPPSAPPVTDRAEPPAEPLAAPATRPRPPPGQPVPGLFRGPLDAIVLRNVDGTTVLGRNEPGGFERLPIRIIELTDRKS
ncbi:MAG TPA: hypothetical protein VK601_16680, partial [Kofleriaceae bacterium]|nr:hypothetical protein [Kofleriaceae bacterium]